MVNDGCRLPAAFVHHESDSAHGNNLAEKRGSKIKTNRCGVDANYTNSRELSRADLSRRNPMNGGKPERK
jgi:hypothetical protein